MLQRQGRLADQVRDRHGASRAVAYLMLISAPYVCVTGVFLTPDQTTLGAFAVAFTCVCIAACGLVCRFRPDVMPDFFWIAVPFLAAAVISGLNVITNDATTGAQLFYLWPVFYAANFLSRPRRLRQPGRRADRRGPGPRASPWRPRTPCPTGSR